MDLIESNLTDYSKYIHRSRYSRYDDSLGRRETWPETVSRLCDFWNSRFPDVFPYELVHDSILSMRTMPSMRSLMTAGEAATRDEVAIFNCSYLPIDDPRAFDEAMYLLMNGVGVGFSVERQFVNELPAVAEELYPSDTVITVKDSKIGWCSAFRELLSLLWAGKIPVWDMSKVRPQGARLKTFGGRASGPGPLEDLFRFAVAIFKGAKGRKLNSLECHDLMCKVGEIVVVGGVRRSALISLSNLSDDRMRDAKSGAWWETNVQRALANNSTAYTEKPDVSIFLKELKALIDSKSGERGIFNRIAAQQKAAENGRRLWEFIQFGTNPCLPGDTWVHTVDGPRQVRSLVGEAFVANLNGDLVTSTSGGFWSTGIKPVFEVELTSGHKIRATANHQFRKIDGTWAQVSELQTGDTLELTAPEVNSWAGKGTREQGWLLGQIVGDGGFNPTKYPTYLRFWGASQNEMAETALDIIRTEFKTRADNQGTYSPINRNTSVQCRALDQFCADYLVPATKDVLVSLESTTSSEFVQGFLSGLFDADGTVSTNLIKGCSVRLSQNNLLRLEMVQRMLHRFGIKSKIYKNRREGGFRELPDGNGGEKPYWCHANHELVIANESVTKFTELVGFVEPEKQARLLEIVGNRKRRANRDFTSSTVAAITYCGEEEVFDCTIPTYHWFDANGLVSHNCGEILLRPLGLCNLTEVVVRPDDTLETLIEKVRVATILGTFQSTMTNFRYLRAKWKKNADEERLLGVSLTGEMDHPVLQTVNDEARKWLETLKAVAVETNKEWAEKLGIPVSAAITCVKPSGCRPETALVTTDKGIYTLGELRPEGQGVWQSLEREDHDTLGGGKATKFFDNGITEVFAVNMNFGMSVESTANHRWEVKGKGFVRTDELEPGDVLKIVPGVYAKSTESPLIDVPNPQCNSVSIKMPSEMSADLAWLLGYLWGDGCLSPGKHRIRFIDANIANLEKAQQILLNLFGLESNIFPASNRRKAFVLEKGSSHLWTWLVTNGFFKYTERGEIAEIPLRVREASKESILAFFAGLFDADGHFKNGKASLTTADPKFSKHVQDIAWAVGLCLGRSHNTKGGNLQPTKSMWLMAVSANTSEEVWGVLQRHSNKITGDLSRQRQYAYGIVQDVVSIGEQPTYDIETEAHWFWAGAVKSHNTVSQLVDSASGLHGRFSPYYIRTVRADKKDPLAQMMKDCGIPCEDDVTKPHSTFVFSFPMKAPDTSRVASDIPAIEQLEIWKMYRDCWCEHNPSVTIYVGDNEWLDVGAWVYRNFDSIGGISFLPRTEHVYKQAPYQPISKEEYEAALAVQPKIPWELLTDYEKEDQTTGTQELACIGNSCEFSI